MFGALNRFISRLDAEPQAQPASTRTAFGFQVLRNTNADLPVEPWFDFVVGINGRTVDSADPKLFSTEVRNCAGSSVELGIWSAKGQRIRSLYVPIPPDTAALGLSLQWTPLSSTEDVWHILDVSPNSPADEAGLLPYGDYIIGTPECLVKGESGLGELVEDYLGQPLRLWVYNHEYNVTRLVSIHPSRTWGGNGALGCVLGFGALHRIPASLDEPPQGPGEMLFESARFSSDTVRPGSRASAQDNLPQGQTSMDTSQYVVPAEMKLPPPPPMIPATSPDSRPPPPTSGVRKSRAVKSSAVVMDMDEYFREGEAKSREQDFAPSPKPGEGIAPPPKSGPPAGRDTLSPPPQAASPSKREDVAE